jgi:esterase
LKLFSREYGEGKPLLIAHGLFGMSDNWIEIAKALADTYKVYLLDLRNHGQSPHDPVHTYDAMAEDILEFLDDRQIPKASFIGHSMGGKVVMNFAARYPGYVDQLIVVDISPGAYNELDRTLNQQENHQQVIDLMVEINKNRYVKRSELHSFLNSRLEDEFTKQVIQKNIQKGKNNSYEIRMNIDAIIHHFKETRKEINLTEDMKFLDILFIFGSESPYYRKQDELHIMEKLPYAQIKIVKDAGHIVHMDKKTQFIEFTKTFLLNP